MNFTTTTTRSQNLRTRKNSRRGSIPVEYIGIACLVAFAALPIFSSYGSQICKVVDNQIRMLSGEKSKLDKVTVDKNEHERVHINQENISGVQDVR